MVGWVKGRAIRPLIQHIHQYVNRKMESDKGRGNEREQAEAMQEGGRLGCTTCFQGRAVQWLPSWEAYTFVLQTQMRPSCLPEGNSWAAASKLFQESRFFKIYFPWSKSAPVTCCFCPPLWASAVFLTGSCPEWSVALLSRRGGQPVSLSCWNP